MKEHVRASERFLGDVGLIDLDQEAADLLERATHSQHGHAQRTLYRHSGSTIAMFAFRGAAGLPSHRADGVVSVQVLRGRIELNAGGECFELAPGRMVRMAPGLPHDLRAIAASVVLVHIARAVAEPAPGLGKGSASV